MKAIKIISTTICALLIMSFQSMSNPKTLIGKWKSENGPKLSVEFYLEKDGTYYGKISDPTDKYYGKMVFKKMVYDQKENCFSGTLTPADKDITLNTTVSIESNNKLKVVAKKLLITRVIYFSKIN